MADAKTEVLAKYPNAVASFFPLLAKGWRVIAGATFLAERCASEEFAWECAAAGIKAAEMAERSRENERKRFERNFTDAELARFYEAYGWNLDSRDKKEKEKKVNEAVEWAIHDRGNLARIARASEDMLEEQRKTNRELRKLAKATAKLSEVLDLFKTVLTPVAEKAQRFNDD